MDIHLLQLVVLIMQAERERRYYFYCWPGCGPTSCVLFAYNTGWLSAMTYPLPSSATCFLSGRRRCCVRHTVTIRSLNRGMRNHSRNVIVVILSDWCRTAVSLHCMASTTGEYMRVCHRFVWIGNCYRTWTRSSRRSLLGCQLIFGVEVYPRCPPTAKCPNSAVVR
ncbi:uncharacterized protein C8Q71DRAFT_733729 [Rhodofomes roseus]|uniref:Secreted protein n=1 Tax=Rhodofomes roseus TaxID=34475 RepID=A0ABQ8KUI7_9APHY|nr:uncharacterized protein C8Q71DRAFT_733729 [Rhodofomes roseus]KAH9842639.1 hypothetical protein C8Q71DRAFT_733729 [Rhodofomes roseus]